MPVVVCDLGERRGGVPQQLTRLGVEIEWAPLPVGDFAIGRTVLVERKTVIDLHGTVAGGRYWSQIGRLRVSCRDSYLVVEGTDVDEGPLSPNAVRGCLVATLDLGVRLTRSRDANDTALWLQRLLVRHGSRRPRLDKPAYAQRPKPMTPATAAQAMLASVPGISTELAVRLLGHFGSLQAVLEAGPDRWAEVSGIGPARVQSLAASLTAIHPADRAAGP
jgi:ERCC4-type nuclease